MPRIINDFQQNTPEWEFYRLPFITASGFHVFLGSSKTKEDKLWEKIAERKYMDSDREDFFNPYLERGHILEPEARKMYEFTYNTPVEEVGFVEEDGEFDGYVGCSPDGLVGVDGLIEIKSLSAKYILQYTEKGDMYVRPEYMTQMQFNMFVCDRAWCDLIYYHPRAGFFVKRIMRDDEYIERIKNALRDCVAFIKKHEEQPL